MATRRSSRHQNVPTGKAVDDKQYAPAKSAAGGEEKPKTSAAKTAGKTASTTEIVSRGKGRAGKQLTTTEGKAPKVRPPSGLTNAHDKVSSLPPEVLNNVLDNIKDPLTISALGRTSKKFYSLMMPRLYGRIAVAAMFHAHIPKLIRALEPHLTIEQKKQLKKEGKYKGQQERHQSGHDEKATPICAGYVRQLIVGVGDPGKKHKYIVERYVEEALKNMDNLEIVETRMITK
jgi:hypothetical protein